MTTDAHRLIREEGLAAARRAASSKFERSCIDAAAAFARSDDRTMILGGIGVTCLPHRRPTAGGREVFDWYRRVGERSFWLGAGDDASGVPIGIPYGAKARLILIHLHDRAMREGASFAPDASMGAWIAGLGVSHGGASYRHMLDQARRIATCRLSYAPREGPVSHGAFVAELLGSQLLPIDPADPQIDQFPQRIVLHSLFDALVREAPVPLRRAAVRLIGDNSWAIDLYLWMAYRLPLLDAEYRMSWAEVTARFGLPYQRQRQLRASLSRALCLVRAVYPEANVAAEREALFLWPSPGPR